jgi:hypothetical protein
VKSNLKWPLKFRMRSFNSWRPSPAMEAASVSRQLLVLILVTLERNGYVRWIHTVPIVSVRRLLAYKTRGPIQTCVFTNYFTKNLFVSMRTV